MGVTYSPVTTGAGARRTGWRRSRAEARATRQEMCIRDSQKTAWATALVLLAFVLLLSVAARLAAWRISRRAH